MCRESLLLAGNAFRNVLRERRCKLDDCRRSFPVTCTQTIENPSLPICDEYIKMHVRLPEIENQRKRREKLEISFHVAYEMSDLCDCRMWKCASVFRCFCLCSATQLFDSLTQFQVLLIVLLNL